MIKIRDVNLKLSTASILKNINVDISGGELLVVLGPNGAGKSSLLKVASGEIAPEHGKVDYWGLPLKNWPVLEKAKQCAVLAQQLLLDFPFSAFEVVLLGRTPHDTGNVIDNNIADEALALMDVKHLRNQLYTELSGGEKQRVQLARVLAQVWEGDNILLLDEPTSALDFSHQQQVMNILKKRAMAGSAVLMVLHDLNLAASFADKIILMSDGEVRAVGTPAEVLEESLLQEIFKIKFHQVVHPATGRRLFLS